MKLFLYCALFLLESIYAENLELSSQIYENSNVEFISHAGSSALSSYVAMNINFIPVKNLYQSLQSKFGEKLINRGESHITVITPVEYANGLKDKISIKELNEMALESKLQSSKFEVICLGKGEKKVRNNLLKTYFLVVNSEDLLHFRKKVELLFRQRGGQSNSFKAEHFYPHITVGFSKRDLHESDGVIKNVSSCYEGLNMVL